MTSLSLKRRLNWRFSPLALLVAISSCGSDAGMNPMGAAGSGGTGGSGGSAGMVADSGGVPVPGPDAGTYGSRSPLAEANSEMGVAEVGGKIYVVGGYPSSRVVQATVQVYDPKIDTWTLAAPLPMPIHHPVLGSVNGKLYSLGGQLGGANGQAAETNTDRSLVYDPAANVWTEVAPMPTARGAGAAAVIDDKIYVAGGRPPASNAFAVYDVSDNAWTTLTPLPQLFPNRNHIAAAAIGGKVYVAGGRHSGGSFSSPMTDSLDVYDPGTATWASRASMLRPRGGVNGVAAYGCFFVWGGEGSNTGEPNDVFPDHDVYDPSTNTWTALARLPTPVHGVTGAVFLDGLIYIPGGGTSQGGSSGSTIFQIYRPDRRCE
jgi:N-acetylneuraminic acid mutarotase